MGAADVLARLPLRTLSYSPDLTETQRKNADGTSLPSALIGSQTQAYHGLQDMSVSLNQTCSSSGSIAERSAELSGNRLI
jgi:hypothetical protein